ncbi:YtxH domain-containing protein [Mucilaginibacter litoreus]|uniref:YtxH domain-containing protein n=1 Tax=Mucilaginibacter litoreus TaxID=1048221 RepID=A0ABW3ASK3_9SPHI
MGLIKFIAVGAAVGLGINYLTKKRADGRSVLDDITDKAPEWIDKAKNFATDQADIIAERVKS